MPKQPLFESFRHRFLLTAKAITDIERVLRPETYPQWYAFIQSLTFAPVENQTIELSWTTPKKGKVNSTNKEPVWYYRGDTPLAVDIQKQKKLPFHADAIGKQNQKWFWTLVVKTAKQAGLTLSPDHTFEKQFDDRILKHFADEERLFDSWAKDTDPTAIDVVKRNESPTAPEMRYITKLLGNIRGKKILDVGAGLGEASVYFALKGARVTALDLSRQMLDATDKLAKHNRVTVKLRHAAIEHLNIPKNEQFDVIYAGNLFHHVNIPLSLGQLLPHLKPDGHLVCWEPVAYNPAINMYRNIATSVRSHDERPMRLSDIEVFRRYFKTVQTRWFWLTTLIVFVIMVVVQKRNPNKTRLWKAVVEEGNQWSWLYMPLEKIDYFLLSVFPFLGPLCWNVVIHATRPKKVVSKK